MSDEAPTRPADDPVEELLEQCLLRWEAEGESALDELCRDHPGHASELREAIALLRLGGITPPRSDLPERLGEFRIVSRLGDGGMGAVFVAEQESLQRRVALKLMRPELHWFGPSRERFRREAEAIARLQHAAIVPVYAWGEERGIPYFAMELVEGCSLAAVLAELAGRPPAALTGADLAAVVARRAGQPAHSPWPLTGTWTQVVCQIGLQIAGALQHAHDRGVLHRDVKPSNIVLGVDGRARLLDFGLARTEGDAGLTRSGTALGSLAYMPPEQLLGRRDLDGRSDVYALGVTLRELLSLRRPFPGSDAEQLRAAILDGRCEPMPRPGDELGRDLVTICDKAIEPEPDRRYATPRALAQDLEAAMAGRPLAARPRGPLQQFARRVRRRPGQSALLLLLMLALPAAAVLGTLWWRERPAGQLGRSVAERAALVDQVTAAFFAYKGAAHDQARPGFDAVLRRDPRHALALVGRLLCALSADDGADLDRVLAAHEATVRAHPMLRWFAAEAARLQGSDTAAASIRSSLPAEPPPHAIDWFVLGVVEAWLGHGGAFDRFRSALRAIEQAILLDDSEVRSPIFHVYAAETAAMCGEHETARRAARAIETLWPDSAMALASAGRALLQADGARSVALLMRARDLAPGQAMLHLYLAESLLFQDRIDEAAGSYQAALQLDDRLGSAWGGLALLHLGQGRLAEAATCSERYVAIEPGLGVAWKIRARVLHLEQQWEAARAAYARTVALMPDDAMAHAGYLAVLGHLGAEAELANEKERMAARR